MERSNATKSSTKIFHKFHYLYVEMDFIFTEEGQLMNPKKSPNYEKFKKNGDLCVPLESCGFTNYSKISVTF